MSKITVMFRCDACGLDRVKVEVPARFPNQELKAWIDAAMEGCGAKHALLSPVCLAQTLDLYMPCPSSGKMIGEAALDRELTPQEAEEWRKTLEDAKL